MASKKGKKIHIKIARKIGRARKSFSRGKNKKQLIALALVTIAGLLIYLFRSFIFVAFVNGSPIMRYEYIAEMEKAMGVQTLDNLVTKKLILQDATEKGLIVSDEEIAGEIETISSQIESQGGDLDTALSTQGLTRENLEENIRMQITVEKLLEDKVSVSDEEISEFFENNKNFYEGSGLEEVKEEIKTQLKQEKLSGEYQTWIEELKTNSKIYYFTNSSPAN